MPQEFTFETVSLGFRPFKPTDLDRLAAINADPVVSRFVGDGEPLSREDTRMWIENSRRNVERFGYGTGGVILKVTGELIGWAGIARPSEDQEEIIYGFDRPYWGKGLGRELVTALCQWASDDLGLGGLRATVDRDNKGSIRILRGLGFELAETDYQGEAGTCLFVRLAKNARSA